MRLRQLKLKIQTQKFQNFLCKFMFLFMVFQWNFHQILLLQLTAFFENIG